MSEYLTTEEIANLRDQGIELGDDRIVRLKDRFVRAGLSEEDAWYKALHDEGSAE